MIKYDKRKFDAYQTPGVDEAIFKSGSEDKNYELTGRKKQSWWRRLFSKIFRKKPKKKAEDEYEKGRERVKKIINN